MVRLSIERPAEGNPRAILTADDGTTVIFEQGVGGGGSMTAGEILAALLTVDGSGSGLDADLLDGLSSAGFALSSHVHVISDVTGLQAALDAKVTGPVDTAEISDAAVTNAKLANVNSKTLKGRTAANSGVPTDLTMVQTMAMLINSAIHYGCWYGGVVTLASGSDTVLALGVEASNSGAFTLATNQITVSPACVALLVWYSVMIEGTGSAEAQVSVQLEQDPATGTYAVVTGTRKDGFVDADDVDTDRNTISGFFIVAPSANYKYQLTGRIQSGAATAKTVSAGTSLMVLGLSNA